MKLSLDVSLVGPAPCSLTLETWYANNPLVRRLWAIESTPAEPNSEGRRSTRVILMLEPTLDGDETSPAWMAKGRQWSRELQSNMSTIVLLELLDGPLPTEFEIDGEGVLVAALCWRESDGVAN